MCNLFVESTKSTKDGCVSYCACDRNKVGNGRIVAV
jgi:hypothetical protein